MYVPVRTNLQKRCVSMSRSNGRPELEVIANVCAALQGSVITMSYSSVYRWFLIFKRETRGSFPSWRFSGKATSKTAKGRVAQFREERRC